MGRTGWRIKEACTSAFLSVDRLEGDPHRTDQAKVYPKLPVSANKIEKGGGAGWLARGGASAGDPSLRLKNGFAQSL
jgi:hypothetical protein